jgi:outer membrane protein TolC
MKRRPIFSLTGPACRRGWLLAACVALAAFPASAAPKPVAKVQSLSLSEVLSSVQSQYPPYLAALIEQDIANGRVRQAAGAFDLNLNVGGSFNLAGYYDGNTGYALLEQPLPFWGGSVYGGYRLSSGFLPNYNKDRTSVDGEGVLGFRIPLLRDGTIDRRRAALWQAQIDQELADPVILRQYLDFIRTASVSYYQWTASGQRLSLTEELLRIANDRDGAIAEQVKNGASAPIIRIDNQRLMVSRQIAVVQAKRRFEAATIELSLFLRTRDKAMPVLVDRARVPSTFGTLPKVHDAQVPADLARALNMRPELRRLDLLVKRTEIDRRLAKNNLLPNLDVGIEAGQFYGDGRPKDLERSEIEAKVELKVPLERNEAKGRMEVADATLSRLENDRQFARDRIMADVRDSFSALVAAHEALEMTRKNVELAGLLEEAENERLKQGATDLLALQIREQASFDARVLEVDAQAELFRAYANYRAAIAADATRNLPTLPTPAAVPVALPVKR